MKHPKRTIGAAVVVVLLLLIGAAIVVIAERDTTGPGDLAGRIFVRGCRAGAGDIKIAANAVQFTSLAAPNANPADNSTTTTSTSTTTSSTTTSTTTTTESTTTLAPDTGSSLPTPTLGTIAPGFTVTTFPGRTTTSTPSTTGVAATGELPPVRLIRTMTKPIEAKVSGSGEHLSFHVTGTTMARAYALDVRPTGRCAKAHVVFGNGMGGATSPFGALAAAHDVAPISNLGLVVGGTKSIDISLVAPVFAVTGGGAGAGDGLEVYGGSPTLLTIDGALRNNWTDVDDVPIGGTRVFHWASSANGTSEGEMQMSTTPMGDTCADPADLVTRGQVEFATGSLTPDKTGGMFSLDLTPWTKPQWSPGEGPSDEPGKQLPLGGGATTTTAKKKTGDPQAPPLQGQTGDPHPHPFEGTYYVRVVPRDGKGACTGAATNSVTLRIGYPGVGLLGQTTLQVYAGSPGYQATADNINSYYDQWALQDDHVRWDDAQQGSRMFRWSSTVDGTTTGEWQLSTGPFPSDCHDPPGLIATGAATFAPGPLGTSVAGRPTFTIDMAAVAAKQAVGGTPLSHDLPLYVRVVPHAGGAKTCAGSPSQPALLKWAAPASQGIPGGGLGTGPEVPTPPTAKVTVTISGYQRYQGLAYNVGTYCFVTLADHDVPEGLAAVNDPVGLFATLSGHGNHFTKGEPFCFTPSKPEPSWWQKAVSFVVDAVSFPSKVWELYVDIIPAILGEVLTSMGFDCSPGDSVGPGNGNSKGKPASDCFKGLLAAEKIGLAAAGVPPSLPDAAALVDQGEDYLVGLMAEESGVDPSAAREAYDKGKSKITSQLSAASSAATGFPCDWCGYDSGARIPRVTVQISRPADTSGLPSPNRLCVRNANSPDTLVYQPLCVELPQIAAGHTLTLPLRIEPFFSPTLAQHRSDDYEDCLHGHPIPPHYIGCADWADVNEFQSWAGSVFGKVPTVHFLAETKEYWVKFPQKGITATATAGGSDYKTFDTN